MTLTRDARHLALPQVGAAGQQRIAEGRVLLIGVGGIGCAAAAYLASSGVGHIRVCDFDTVDETNLGRQVLYAHGHVGERKAEVAAERLRKINPDISVTAICERLTGDALVNAVSAVDVVLDGSDNFATRFASKASLRFSAPTSLILPAMPACTPTPMNRSATAQAAASSRRSPVSSAR